MSDVSIIIAFVALLVVCVAAIVGMEYLRSKLDAGTLETVAFWVNAAVSAAEQIFHGEGLGKDKKNWVLDFLEAKGIMNDASLNALIEAAVQRLNKQ